MTEAFSTIMSHSKTTPATDTSFWEAVMSRNQRLDGVFYYAVTSTKIFCKPSCPSRRPKESNVAFYFSREAAERAGFRACLRCKPAQTVAIDARSQQVRATCEYIEKNLEDSLTLESIAHQVGGSPFQLQRNFKDVVGVSPRQYIEARRFAAFRTALRFGNGVADAGYAAGFSSSSRLYEKANAHLGMAPAAYQRGAARQHVAYTVSESPLGKILVATTTRGICKIALGDSMEALQSALFREFPKAFISRDEQALKKQVAQIVEHLEGSSRDLNLPLDLRATAFQLRVWKELQKIPRGETRSYQQVAKSIGRPAAARAVARACASNPVALAVPCHRVVRGDGGMGGYRWGLERKRKLLRAESASNSPKDQTQGPSTRRQKCASLRMTVAT